MHLIAPQIQAGIDIPLLHIADATAEEIIKSDIKKVGLLGTAFTMEKDFYKRQLEKKYQLDVSTPNVENRKTIHRIIDDELCLGNIQDVSRNEYLKIIDKLVEQGAETIILGCTEITLLIKPQHTKVKLFDTTMIHALISVDMALNQ